MTSSYPGSGFDFYGGQSVAGLGSAYTGMVRDVRNRFEVADVVVNGKPVPGVKQWQATIHNTNGGLGRVWGTARDPSPYYPFSDLDRAQSATLNTAHLGSASLPIAWLTNTVSSAFMGANPAALASCNILDRLVISCDARLFKETSNTDPTLIELTYTAASDINYLAPVVIGGATQAERLAVCMKSSAVQILADLTTAGPTSSGSMNALTNPCWGIQMSPINATTPGTPTLLIYANGNIYSLASSAAIGTAPTSALSGVPNGGYPISIVALKDRPVRAYWFFPHEDLTQSCLTITLEEYGQIWSTNLEGTDPQLLYFPSAKLFYVCRWQDNIVATDCISVWAHDGTNARSLNWPGARPIDTETMARCVGFAVHNGNLYAYTERTYISGTIPSTVTVAVEKYNPETNTWQAIASSLTPNALGIGADSLALGIVFGRHAPNSLPVSNTTSNMHLPLASAASKDAFFSRLLVQPELDPFYHLNKSGSGTTIPTTFSSSGTLTSVAMSLEGLESFPSVIEEVRCMADIATGGTDAQWKIEFASETANSTLSFTNAQNAIFLGTDLPTQMRKYFTGNKEQFSRLQYKLTLTQGADTHKTSNGVPFIIRGLTFLDGNVRAPDEVRAGR